MIRLICSSDRQGLETLESKLTKAGILSEVRGNPLTTALGISRFELFVREEDLSIASELSQTLAKAGDEGEPPGNLRNAYGFNGRVDSRQSDLLIEARPIPTTAAEPRGNDGPDSDTERESAGSQDDLVQATALLEKEVEAMLARETQLMDRCSSLEEKLKTVEQTLARTRADLTRETSIRSEAERKVAQASEARASLEKEMHALELRLKTAEQSLAASQKQLDLQVKQQEKMMKERWAEQVQVRTYVGTVNELRCRVRARLSAEEDESGPSSGRRVRKSVAEK